VTSSVRGGLIRTARLASIPIEAPFVGREQLLQHIHELADVARGGQGVVVALSGEAGIGKTRLLREVARWGPDFGFRVHWIRHPRRVDAALAGLPDDRSVSSDTDPGTRPLPFTLLGRSRRPHLVAIDDALQADRLPDLTALATAGVARLPLLVLLGLSPDLNRATTEARRLLASLARQRVLAQVPVPPLGEAELFELATHLLGGRPDPRLQGTISSLSEGNPLLAEALMADLLERGQVSRQADRRGLLGEVPATYTPPAVSRLLGQCVESIDTDVLQSLASAAMLGSGFRFAALEQATGQPADRLLEHLEAGLASGILSETAEPPDDFQFTHELVRRALQAGVSRVRRRRLQQAVAGSRGRQREDRPGSDRATARPGRVDRAEDEAGALALALRSLEHAERLCSWEEASRQCRSALDLTRRSASADPVGEIQLLDRLAALYFGRVQTFAAGACLREALQLCERIDLPLRRVVLTARLAALGPSWCSIEGAEALFEQVVRSACDRASFDRAALFDAHLELGFAHQRHGRVAAALPYLRSARDTVDPADWARHTLGLFALGALLISTGDVPEAAGLLRAALTSLDSGMAVQWSRDDDLIHWRDPRRTRCLALAELARALDLMGRTDEAERYAEAAREEEVRFGILGGRAHRASAQVELRRGRAEAALRLLSAKSDEAAPGSLSMRRAADLVLVSAAHLALGNLALALETASEGVSICVRSGAGESLAGLHLGRARALLALGQLEAAREAVVAAQYAIDDHGTEVYRAEASAVDAAIRAASDPLSPHSQERVHGARRRARATTAGGPAWTPNAPEARAPAAAPVPVAYVRGRSLTIREREILGLMAAGKTNRQIAVQVGVSDKTVKRHVSNIFDKLAANTRAMAVRRGFESGIL
jgi:DNA-binding NarL/FixJ family response regulator